VIHHIPPATGLQLPAIKVNIQPRLNSLFISPAIFIIELLRQQNQRDTPNKLLTCFWQID
jgi:hypothetical protein